ncbi:MAG: STN domain-containing protein [Candidatus Cryptobacteroides sp.]
MKAYKALKLTAAAVLLLLLAPSLSAQQEKISLSLTNASLKVFLNEIESQTGWTFSYRDSEIEGKAGINIEIKDASVSDVLNSELTRAGLVWKIVGDKIVITPHQKESPADPKNEKVRLTCKVPCLSYPKIL